MSEKVPLPPPDGRSLRVAIVDDEAPARRGLVQLLRPEPDMAVVAECGDGDEAVAAIERERPDLVLLDVQMPGRDGFAVMRALSLEPLPAVVFVTAFDAYAVAAFDAAAIDYLLKPVSAERFRAALDRVRQRLRERTAARVAAARPPGSPPAARPEKLAVRLGDRTELVPVAAIDWIEADGDYVRLHTGARMHLLSLTLAELLVQLDPAQFAQIHRSRIVRLDRVKAWQRGVHGEYLLQLADGRHLAAGRSFTKLIAARLQPRTA